MTRSPCLDDVGGFTEAYRVHGPRARAAAHSVLGDQALAEDVVQDVFTALWTRPSMFDGRRGSLGPYITLLARSRALDRWRTRAASGAATERVARHTRAAHAPDVADEVVDREAYGDALRALRTRPPEQREAVLLCHVGGLTHREIASITRAPVGTVKSRVRLGVAGAARRLAA